jgi:hypothetical protein
MIIRIRLKPKPRFEVGLQSFLNRYSRKNCSTATPTVLIENSNFLFSQQIASILTISRSLKTLHHQLPRPAV